MSTILLNNIEFEFNSYTRNISFHDGIPSENVQIIGLNSNNLNNFLNNLQQPIITSIQIKKDNVIIYNLENLNLSIISIIDSYMGENTSTTLLLETNINTLEEEEEE